MRFVIAGGLAALIGLSAGGAQAQTPEAFYKGKTVSLVMGTGPGGSYDLYGRLIATHIAKHIPGQPNIIV
jgi:tripartite-type tricarboxylate transporter receptor subunit TctC